MSGKRRAPEPYGGHNFAAGGGGKRGPGRNTLYYGDGARRRSNMVASSGRAGGAGRFRRKVYPAGARRRGYVPRALVAQGVETKYLDMTGTAALSGAAGWTGAEIDPAGNLCLNTMVQGTSASQREGRKITNVSIEVIGTIYQANQADQAAADVSPTVFLALVLDTQTNGAQLNSEDVYINPSGVGAALTAPLRNMLYSKRFKVLKTWTKALPQLPISYDGTNMEQAGQGTPFKMFKTLGFVTEFLGNAGTIADISNSSLHLIGVTSNTSTAPTIYYNARLRFRG